MKLLQQLFLNMAFTSGSNLLMKTIMLSILAALLIWLIQLFLVGRRVEKDLRKDLSIRLNFLRALVIFMFINNLYLFFFIKNNGLYKFQWQLPMFYLTLSPQLIVFIGTAVIFLERYIAFKKFIRK
jgi:hypothetical protein